MRLSIAMVAVGIIGACSSPASVQADSAPGTADGFQKIFDAKTDSTWRAADGNATVSLPGGKVAWLFGDTMRLDKSWVRNSILVQEGTRLTSTNGGQAIPNDADLDFYWPTDGIMDGGLLRVFAGRLGSDFTSKGVSLVTFRFDSRGYPIYKSKMNITSANEDTGIQWGTAVTRNTNYVFVYGQKRVVAPYVFGRNVYVARVPVGQLATRSAWRYWTGSTWGSSPAMIEKAQTGRWASNFSVDKMGTKWVVVSKENDFLGDRIIKMQSSSPVGPFTVVSSLPTPMPSDQWTYQAEGHPEFKLTSGKMLVTWNRGSNDAALVFSTQFPKPVFGEF